MKCVFLLYLEQLNGAATRMREHKPNYYPKHKEEVGVCMHELGIMTGVLDSVTKAAQEAGALRVLQIDLMVGEMTEAIEEALYFAFEAISEGTLCEGAKLLVHTVPAKSICLECGNEFEHDRFHMTCPVCKSYATQLIAGRELHIDSIEVDLPDD